MRSDATHVVHVTIGKCSRDFALVEGPAGLVFDQNGHPSGFPDVACPRQRLIEVREFLEQHAVLVDWRNRVGPGRTAVDFECHESCSFTPSPRKLPRRSRKKRWPGT